MLSGSTSCFHQARRCSNPDGVLLHGLWTGTTVGERRGLHYQFYTPDTFAAAVPPMLELLECTHYQEMDSGGSETDEDDSIRVILRQRQASTQDGRQYLDRSSRRCG